MYSGKTVLAIIDVLYAEVDKEIELSYADGYKQGLLEYAPQVEQYKTMSKELQKVLEKEKRKTFWNTARSVTIGVVAGGILTGLVIGVLQ